MQTTEIAIRLIVIGQALLIAAIFLFGNGTRAARISGAMLMLSVAGYLYGSDASLRGAIPDLLPVVMLLAMLWSTQGDRFESIFIGANSMIACLAPPISAVFVWGVFWPRGTRQASLATLVIGFVLGAAAFTFDFPLVSIYEKTIELDAGSQVVPIKLITEIWGIPFMLQAWWLFVICSGVFFVISLLTPPPLPEQTDNLCWPNPIAVVTSEKITRPDDPRVIAAILTALMVTLFCIFA